MLQSDKLVPVSGGGIRESRGMHRLRLGQVQKDAKIDFRRVHPLRGQHMLKFWSNTHAIVAPSLAEAELGAAVKAGQEVLGMMSLWKDVSEATRGHVMGDASAAIGIILPMGLGEVRHFNTSWLWVQEKEASRELEYHKVKGSDNSADLFKKALDHDSIRRRHPSIVAGRAVLVATSLLSNRSN